MYLSKLYISSILLFLSLFSFSQDDKTIIDSLINKIKTSDNKSKVEILNNLSKSYWEYSLDSSLYYANEALNLAHMIKDKKGISDAYNRIGNVYHFRNDIELALEFYQKCLDIRLEVNDSKGITNICNNMANLYVSKSDYQNGILYYNKALNESIKRKNDEDISTSYRRIANTYLEQSRYKDALENYMKSLDIAQQLNDEIAIASTYNGMGYVYLEISSYDKALKYFLDALEIYKRVNQPSNLSMIYNNIGILYQSFNEIDKALDYFLKALEIDTKSNQKEGQASAYNNIGISYDKKGDKEKALEYYNKALILNTELELTKGISSALNNIGLIYLNMGDYNKAYNYIHESAIINEETNNTYHLANNHNNLAKLFLLQKQYPSAQNSLNLAIKLSKQINIKEWLIESYDLYYQLHSELNDYKKALEYYKLYSEMKDSIFTSESTDRITEMKIKYETDKLETENELLKKDNKIHLLELNRQKNIKNYWIAFSILILALAILSFRQFRLKKNINNLLKSKNTQLSDTNQKLIISENNLKELNATKDKFFSIVAHDLKNPFQSLLAFSEAMYNQTEELNKDEINSYNKIIYESSQNLFNLLGNLLQWSKSQLGNMKFSPKQINIFESVYEALTLNELLAQNKNIIIENFISKEKTAFVDKHVLSSVLRNLISNALKFTNQGGKIELSTFQKGNSITISVKDNGTGISEENIEKLFKIDEGYSTRGTEKESGTGLGLILCKELISKSNGNISVKSTFGKGSDFQITLPISEKEE